MTGRAPEKGAQPGKNFLDMKGFGDVIVGTGVEALDLIAPAVARGQNQNWHGAPGPAPFPTPEPAPAAPPRAASDVPPVHAPDDPGPDAEPVAEPVPRQKPDTAGSWRSWFAGG
jgi:hypothetical protein